MCVHRRTRVLSTRLKVPGIIVRRRECLRCEDRFTTFEVAEVVVRKFGLKAFLERAAFNQSTLAARSARADRRARIEERLRAGWKPTAIAHDTGVTEARVRQIRAEARS